jgi:SAM-dependent methyltransferase
MPKSPSWKEAAGGLGAREVREAYNAKHSGSILRDKDRFYRLVARRLIRGLDPARLGKARLLDVGCGGGYLLREVRSAAPGAFASLHGIEISDVALMEARRQAPFAALALAQGERLPCADGSFDAVACLGNLEHFMDPRLGARELARACRKDGTAWVLLPNSFYSGDIWRVIRTGYGPDHHQIIDRFASVNEWRDLLESSGLTVQETTPYNRFKWWKRLLPRNLAYHFLYRARPSPGG